MATARVRAAVLCAGVGLGILYKWTCFPSICLEMNKKKYYGHNSPWQHDSLQGQDGPVGPAGPAGPKGDIVRSSFWLSPYIWLISAFMRCFICFTWLQHWFICIRVREERQAIQDQGALTDFLWVWWAYYHVEDTLSWCILMLNNVSYKQLNNYPSFLNVHVFLLQ